jgi:hypothetical protein
MAQGPAIRKKFGESLCFSFVIDNMGSNIWF